jgi:hypothetical protein
LFCSNYCQTYQSHFWTDCEYQHRIFHQNALEILIDLKNL